MAGNATPVARCCGEPRDGPAPGECCLRWIHSTPRVGNVKRAIDSDNVSIDTTDHTDNPVVTAQAVALA